jgi:hypothetical protein
MDHSTFDLIESYLDASVEQRQDIRAALSFNASCRCLVAEAWLNGYMSELSASLDELEDRASVRDYLAEAELAGYAASQLS